LGTCKLLIFCKRRKFSQRFKIVIQSERNKFRLNEQTGIKEKVEKIKIKTLVVREVSKIKKATIREFEKKGEKSKGENYWQILFESSNVVLFILEKLLKFKTLFYLQG